MLHHVRDPLWMNVSAILTILDYSLQRANFSSYHNRGTAQNMTWFNGQKSFQLWYRRTVETWSTDAYPVHSTYVYPYTGLGLSLSRGQWSTQINDIFAYYCITEELGGTDLWEAFAHDNEVDSSVLSPVARPTVIPDRCPPYPRTLGIIFH